MPYEIYLVHHQRKGAHWGIMNGPPYPLSRAAVSGYLTKQKKKFAALSKDTARASTPKAQKHERELDKFRGKTSLMDKVKQAAKESKEKREQKLQKKQADEAANKEADRQLVLRTGSAEDIAARKHDYSIDELDYAIKRLKKEQELESLQKPTINKGAKFVDDTMKKAKTLNDYANTGISLYNNMAKLYNTFGADESKGKSKLPLISGGDKKKK